MTTLTTRRNFLKTATLTAAQVGFVPPRVRSAPSRPAPADALWSVFQQPPAEARASTYWWWKGTLAPGEMSRQLRVLKAAGLGGAHIIPWGSTPAYLTPPWLDLMREAADAAKREGLILDMSANATWPFRGDWVPLAESLHKVAVTKHSVVGPTRFALPKTPAAKKGKAAPGAKGVTEPWRILQVQLAPDPLERVEQLRDATAVFRADLAATLEVPSGRHTVWVTRLTAGLKTNPSVGRVPDHFSPRAIENYLQGFAQRVAPALGGKLANGFRAMYCDSIELSEANWTPSLPAEFRRRCGYDLLPYLPFVLDVEAAAAPPHRGHTLFDATVARVRYDYCRVLVDLFLESLGRTFYRWCHDHGVLCRWQAYGWPLFYGIEDGYRIPDMPEGNNWLLTQSVFNHDVDVHGWPMWQKYTSSGAHQAGRRIASTEAATVVEGKFKETLDQLKRQDDFNFVCGINHSFLHGFCYSPADEPFPGRDQYGTYFSEQNTWWPYFPRWVEYNARLSAVFQASQPVAQVALLFRTADTWAQAGLHRHPYQMDPPWAHQVWRWINQNGANADYVSDQVLQQAKFEQGQIVFGPMRYDTLWVLGAHTLEPATAEALARYARAGGMIVFLGSVPEASPGWREAEASDRKVRTMVQALLRDYPLRVLRRDPPGGGQPAAAGVPWVEVMNRWRKSTTARQCLAWADQLLAELQIPRSVRWDEAAEGLYQIQYRHEGRVLFFFANTTEGAVALRAGLSCAERRIERWDPESVSRQVVPVDRDGRVALRLPPASSLLLVAGEGQPAVESGERPAPPPVARQEITGPWSVAFKPASGDSFEIGTFRLAGLHESAEERLHRFAGQVVYRTRFTWTESATGGVHLDLGAVPNGITETTLNGRLLGVRWYGRHEYAVSEALKPGENELEVKVVTTLFNRVRKPAEPPVAAGLVGPVVLRGANQAAL